MSTAQSMLPLPSHMAMRARGRSDRRSPGVGRGVPAAVLACASMSAYIFDPDELRLDAATATPEVVDLGGATSGLCMSETGAFPVRPHMLSFSPGRSSHAIISFVASGHVVFLDAETRQPVKCFRTEVGAANARQAHAIYPTPRGEYMLVANQNGKKLERILTDYRNGIFTQQPEATLDIRELHDAQRTPVPGSGAPPRQRADLPVRAGDRVPGLHVAARRRDARRQSVHDADVDGCRKPVADDSRDGCGFTEADGWIYGNGGGGNALNPDGWFLYRLTGRHRAYDPENPPNVPARQVIAHDDSVPRDAHGVTKTRSEKYVWFFDRAGNVAEVYRASTGAYTFQDVEPGRPGHLVGSDTRPCGHGAGRTLHLHRRARAAATLGRSARLDRIDAWPARARTAPGWTDGRRSRPRSHHQCGCRRRRARRRARNPRAPSAEGGTDRELKGRAKSVYKQTALGGPGANPVRPPMIAVNPAQTQNIVSFVPSRHAVQIQT